MNTIEQGNDREQMPGSPAATRLIHEIRRLTPEERVPSKAIAKAQADIDALQSLKTARARRSPAALMAFNMIESPAYRAEVRKLAPDIEPELRRIGMLAVESRLTSSDEKRPGLGREATISGESKRADNAKKSASKVWAENLWMEGDALNIMLRDVEKLSAIPLPYQATPPDTSAMARPWNAKLMTDPDFSESDDAPPLPVAEGTLAHEGQRSVKLDGEKDGNAESSDIPLALRKRYLIADNKFFFRGQEGQLAFEDNGKRLTTDSDDPDVARSMVDLAIAKNWSAIKVKGTEDFKREAWLAAALRGLEVEGFKPSKLDLSRLDDLRKQHETPSPNVIEQAVRRDPIKSAADEFQEPSSHARPTPQDERHTNLSAQEQTVIDAMVAILRQRGDSDTAVKMATADAAQRFHEPRAYVGKLLDHGVAPYLGDVKNDDSYFVKLQTAAGERTVWGVDLQRALRRDGSKKGDEIALALQGWKPVAVPVREGEESTNTTGAKPREAMRGLWEVNRLEKLRDTDQARLKNVARVTSNKQPVVPLGDTRANESTKISRKQRADAKQKAPEHPR